LKEGKKQNRNLESHQGTNGKNTALLIWIKKLLRKYSLLELKLCWKKAARTIFFYTL